MKIKVVRGSIKCDDIVYAVGETLDIPEKPAKAIIREGIAEEVLEVQEVAQKIEEKTKPEEKKQPEKPKAKLEVKKETKEVRPSIDWTQKEIFDHGVSIGLKSEDLEGKTKAEMLELIRGGEVL
jgi:hypothetical protein